jgi:hypothetical protein
VDETPTIARSADRHWHSHGHHEAVYESNKPVLSSLTPYHMLLQQTKLNSVAWVCERTIPTEGPQLVGEVSANFRG